MLEYMHTGKLRGFAPHKYATENYAREQLVRFMGTLGIFTTHDIYIVAFLYAKGVKTDFSSTDWTRFLDVAAIILSPEGECRVEYVRSGFLDGIRGVS